MSWQTCACYTRQTWPSWISLCNTWPRITLMEGLRQKSVRDSVAGAFALEPDSVWQTCCNAMYDLQLDGPCERHCWLASCSKQPLVFILRLRSPLALSSPAPSDCSARPCLQLLLSCQTCIPRLPKLAPAPEEQHIGKPVPTDNVCFIWHHMGTTLHADASLPACRPCHTDPACTKAVCLVSHNRKEWKSLTLSRCLLVCTDVAACFALDCVVCLCVLLASDIWRWKMSVQCLEAPPRRAELSQCFRFRLICSHERSHQPAVSALISNNAKLQDNWLWRTFMQLVTSPSAEPAVGNAISVFRGITLANQGPHSTSCPKKPCQC